MRPFVSSARRKSTSQKRRRGGCVKLTISEAASVLGSPEERVFAWMEEEALPALKIRGQYFINRTDLLEWATERGVAVSPRAFSREKSTPSLAEALRAGGF